jgi:hypothetical protein
MLFWFAYLLPVFNVFWFTIILISLLNEFYPKLGLTFPIFPTTNLLLDKIGSAGNSYFPVVHLAYLPLFSKKI